MSDGHVIIIITVFIHSRILFGGTVLCAYMHTCQSLECYKKSQIYKIDTVDLCGFGCRLVEIMT